MKNQDAIMKMGCNVLLGIALAAGVGMAGALFAADTPTNKSSSASGSLPNSKDRVSYSIGMNIGNNLKRGNYDVDVEVLAGAIKDTLAGRQTKLTEQEANETMKSYNEQLRTKRDEERLKSAEKNKQAGEAFLAENKKKPGVKTQTVTLPDGKTAEFQYKVLT